MLGSAPVQRVSVVGTSGAGKSTLASSLAAALDADFLELDSIYHQADWVPLPTPEFRRRVALVVADPANGHLRFVRLTSPAAVRRFLRSSGGD